MYGMFPILLFKKQKKSPIDYRNCKEINQGVKGSYLKILRVVESWMIFIFLLCYTDLSIMNILLFKSEKTPTYLYIGA